MGIRLLIILLNLGCPTIMVGLLPWSFSECRLFDIKFIRFIILIHFHVAVTPVSVGHDEISVTPITLLVDCHSRNMWYSLCNGYRSALTVLHQIVTSISLYSREHRFAIRGKTEDSSNFRKLL